MGKEFVENVNLYFLDEFNDDEKIVNSSVAHREYDEIKDKIKIILYK